MDPESRTVRLKSDLAALEALRGESTILALEPAGDPPDRYTLTFRGKGLGREGMSTDVSVIELHQVDLRMPYSYPERPPDVRWLTPIVHPNVSFSGFLNLAEIGLPWSPELTLDILCERLWDVARGAYINVEKAANYAAKNWYEQECGFELPVDIRPLRDKVQISLPNVVKYQRRGETVQLAAGTPMEVMYIDENTPVPPLPPRARRRGKGGEDVLYIGPEN
ncbi:MAG TPA: ubiquitin-conjugating enzyme E2 [Pirellulaceae bacterium]|nr:ubiquitin-conjugating enzyme E2 [Pirellulaceae bacterium]